ncbi:DUF177 domain-containing protein [Altererythrobacter arenosus]|uniref:DUF177 domain-containing protein n=1 Tax=Altererythrobacter arenosus TaxID=3032592 RepID=A0ABY8G193_9SPHN|nr:YceD family protein [Altererythrobacter sp. CAU 1644]WFL78199.1 DUF177 domain-containing protein [Altererythrobacter sp. CAU 1644]
MSENELTRIVKARQLPAAAIVIDADENERTALARRFGIPAVNAIHAEISLEEDGKAVLARGTLTANIVQNCAVSGEEFEVSIDEPLLMRFVKEGQIDPALSEDEEIEIEISPEDCDEIEYSGESFDLGEAVAQSLGLAIDPYAEGPEADAVRRAAGITGDDTPSGPLADALRGLRKE